MTDPAPTYDGTDDPVEASVAELLRRWLPGTPVARRHARRVRRHVISIGAALGVVDPLHPMPFDHATRHHQVQVVAEAVDAHARRLAAVGPRPEIGFHPVATAGRSPLPGVVPATLVEHLDVNAATVDDLRALPGLGPVSARRIVARRARAGRYGDLESVRQAGGVAKAAFERAALRLRVGDGAATPSISTVEERVRAGGLAELLALWSGGAIRLPDLVATSPPEPGSGDPGTTDPAGALVEVLGGLAAELALSPLRPHLWAPDPGRLRRAQVALRRDQALRAGAARDGVRVAPVTSSGYRPLLLGLLDHAEREIYVSMFYFSLGPPDATHPTTAVVEALAAAVGRGVDVRLVLDDDLPEDRHGAGVVNGATFEALEARGIPVRRDHLEVSSHAKALVVDRHLTVVGSHNWTASSFYRYQETSCLLDSADLGEQVAQLLTRRWQLLAPPEERIVPVEQLELLDATARAAVVAAGLADGPAFLEASRTAARRAALVPVLGLGPEDVVRVRQVVGLMQALTISELTALALVTAGMATPRHVARASRARLRDALSDLRHLPEPFGLCSVLPEMADHLAEEAG